MLRKNMVDIIANYNSTTMFFLNMRYPPLHIYEVRKAIDMALDKDDIIQYAAFGYGTDAQMIPFAPGLSESNEDVAWKKQYTNTDGTFKSLADRIDDANDLLDTVPGLTDYVEGEIRTWTDPDTGVGPIELSFEGLYLSSPTYQRAAELIAEQMEEIGIEIVPTVETGAFGPKVFSGWGVWRYETIIFGYPSSPDFDGLVKQWGQPGFGGDYDGSVVGWNNDPSMAPPAEEGYRPQTYETPYYRDSTRDPTQAELDLWMNIYNQLVAQSAPLSAALRETRTIIDDDERMQAVLDVQEDFADALPIITLYHPQFMSAYRTDEFTGWGDPEGIFYYGFAPPTVSVRTLMNVEPT